MMIFFGGSSANSSHASSATYRTEKFGWDAKVGPSVTFNQLVVDGPT
jgi:hypothetical protein